MCLKRKSGKHVNIFSCHLAVVIHATFASFSNGHPVWILWKNCLCIDWFNITQQKFRSFSIASLFFFKTNCKTNHQIITQRIISISFSLREFQFFFLFKYLTWFCHSQTRIVNSVQSIKSPWPDKYMVYEVSCGKKWNVLVHILLNVKSNMAFRLNGFGLVLKW